MSDGTTWSKNTRWLRSGGALLAACALNASGQASQVSDGNANVAPACELAPSDRQWIARGLDAWRYASANITKFKPSRSVKGVFFDTNCTVIVDDALGTGVATEVGDTRRHGDTVPLPDGTKVPVAPLSFARASGATLYFAMSTPSVWRRSGVTNPGLGLETMMVAVLIHESSHLAQADTYGRRIERLAVRNRLPESFNDDSLQERFEGNQAFSASVRAETKLLLSAAEARETATARRLIRRAIDMMRSRSRHYFVGRDAYYREAEDVWLTMEGSAQWAAFHWIVDPRGGAFTRQVAIPNFAKRSKWWSQNEGLALFLALERIDGQRLRDSVFGRGDLTIGQLIERGLSTPSKIAKPLPDAGRPASVGAR
ncbi:hypothetical protein [Sphingomonas sp.]|uniref:hypothetical protein n=1 Tax=Sphingomonas sp. TaxID=28214 RepID=UPI0025CD991B|nr:hypothetical protein [Sphingomonas sp.]